MKNEFDSFDDIVKRKMDNAEFAFNESNWAKAAEMIDASREPVMPVAVSKTKYYVLGGGIAAGIILLLGSVYFFNNFKIISNDELAQLTSQSHIVNNISNKNDSKEVIQQIKNNDSNTSESTIEENLVPKVKTNSNSNLEKTEGNNRNKKSNTNSSDRNNFYSSAFKTEQSNKSVSTSNKNSIVENNYNTDASEVSTKEIKSNEVVKVEPSVNSSSKEQTELERTNENVLNATEEINSSEIVDINNLNISQPDTSNSSDFIIPKDYVRINHHEFVAELGAVNSFGWKVNSVRNGNNVSPIAGIKYRYHFNSRNAVSIGASYFYLSNLSEASREFGETTYKFGSTNKITNISINELQYLSLPMAYERNIGSKNKLGIGLNFICLMNIRNKVEIYNETDNNISLVDSYMDKGYGYNQLTNYNAQIKLFYSRKITNNLSLYFEANKAIRNTFHDYNYFNVTNKSNRPLSLSIGLAYKFISR